MRGAKLIAKLLVVLGFGSAAGLASGCASRAQKSRPGENNPAADTVIVRDSYIPVQAMYGVPPARFDRDRPVEKTTEEAAPAAVSQTNE